MRSSHLAQADTRTLNQRSGEPRNGVRQLPISRPRATSDPPRVRTMHRARFARRAARNRQSTIRVGRICGSWSRSRRLHLPADGEPEVEAYTGSAGSRIDPHLHLMSTAPRHLTPGPPMQNLTRVATEPPTTRCMTTSPGRSGAIPYLAAAYEVLADGSQEDPQRTSFDQAPGPGADFIRCSASPGPDGGVGLRAAAIARHRRRASAARALRSPRGLCR